MRKIKRARGVVYACRKKKEELGTGMFITAVNPYAIYAEKPNIILYAGFSVTPNIVTYVFRISFYFHARHPPG